MKLSGEARLAGVLGWPISHSLSPRLHGHWLREYRVDGAYLPLKVEPEKLPEALRGLIALGFRGANVTLPHKERALELCAEVTERAARIGAVNTLVVRDGHLEGDNSDSFGFLENLKERADAWQPEQGPAVVLGAGGAARAILVALLDAGVPEIRLLNRTRSRAESLAEDLGGPIQPLDWGSWERALEGAALLVNTTSLGMQGQPPLDIELDALPRSALVNDIVYVPLETRLLAAARVRGNPVVDGLGMLLHQARPGFESWFGVSPSVTPALRRAVLET